MGYGISVSLVSKELFSARKRAFFLPCSLQTKMEMLLVQCSTLAAAILGNKSKYEMAFISFRDQWEAISNGTVDISTRKTTPNMERDSIEPLTQRGFTFSAPYFYAGLSFVGVPEYVECVDMGGAQMSVDYCRQTIMCILEASVHADFIRSSPEWAGVAIQLAPTYDQMHEMFAAGACNVMSGSRI